MSINSNTELLTAFKIIYEAKSISRADLADKMGISAVTAGKIAKELIARKYVVQFTRIAKDSNKSALHLSPNKKLHLFLLDISSGKLYLSDICGNISTIADYGCISDEAIFDKYIYLLSDAYEMISRQKYKNNCFGIFITGNDDHLRVISLSNTEIFSKFKVIPYSNFSSYINVNHDGSLMRLILTKQNISFTFTSTDFIITRDISHILNNGTKLLDVIKYVYDNNKTAATLATEIANLDTLFNPDKISIFTNHYDNPGFNSIMMSMVKLLSRETADKMSFISKDTDLISRAINHLINDYIEKIGNNHLM